MAKIDYTKLLTSEMSNNEVWDGLFKAIGEVLNLEVNDPVEALKNIRNPDVSERTINAATTKMLGLDYYSDKFSDDDYKRMIKLIGIYNKTKGTESYADFMGFILDTRITITTLWSKIKDEYSYDEFVYESQAESLGTVIDQPPGEYFPTTHVELSYNQGEFPIEDEAALTNLFYQLAPVHLVLETIIAAHTFNTATLYITAQTLPSVKEWTIPNNLVYQGTIYMSSTSFGDRKFESRGVFTYMNFLDNQTLPVCAYFERNSRASYEDVNGTLQTALTNIPRFSYDAGSLKGILLERVATNLVQNSNAPADQSINVTASTYTASVESGSVTVAGHGVATPGNPITFTATSGSLALTMVSNPTRVQIELGQSHTSFIDTSEYNVRRKDELSIYNKRWNYVTNFTAVVHLAFNTEELETKPIWSMYDNNSTDYLKVYKDDLDDVRIDILVNGVLSSYSTNGVWTLGDAKFAIRWYLSEITIFQDGSVIYSNTSLDLPQDHSDSTFFFGSDKVTSLNGYVTTMLQTDHRLEDVALSTWTT